MTQQECSALKIDTMQFGPQRFLTSFTVYIFQVGYHRIWLSI